MKNFILAVVFLFSAILVSCSEGSGGSGNNNGGTKGSTVGSSGGTVSGNNGAIQMEIPAGALLGPTTFSITSIASITGLSDVILKAGTGYHIGWTGAGFATSGTTTFLYPVVAPAPMIANKATSQAPAEGVEGFVLMCENGVAPAYVIPEQVAFLLQFGYTLGACPGNGVNVGQVALAIAQQPQSIQVSAGNDATFSVVAIGTAPLSYQWQRDGVNITGANSASYTLINTQTTDSGASFRVVVSNSAGSVTSSSAMLTVIPAFASGSLDATFGTGGIVVHGSAAGGNGYDYGRSITTDSSGRVLVTGFSRGTAVNDDMVIWRYTTTGTLDTTFGTNGIVVHNNAAGGNDSDEGTSITVDSSGRILVTGESMNAAGNIDMIIWRYTSAGILDTTFGTGGIVVHGNAAGGNGSAGGSSITTDSSGRILVTGSSWSAAGNSDMVIWRYTSNGTLDTTFGTNGIVVHGNAAGGNGDDRGNSITVDASGRIVVTGQSMSASGFWDMVIWRYDSNGALDTTFGTNGIVVHNNAAGGDRDDAGTSITIDSSGRILVTGFSRGTAGNEDMVIWRYTTTGTLDTTFGTNGIVVHNNAGGGNGYDYGRSITIDSSGRILVTGSSTISSIFTDMVIWRYTSTGTLDTAFGAGGIVLHSNSAGGNSDSGTSITVDSSGRILVTGAGLNASFNPDMVIWRYLP